MAFMPSKSISAVILDEIALEGLEGISIAGLWIRLSDTLQLPLPLLSKFQDEVWKVIREHRNYLTFYELPEPREKLKIWNRFSVTDPDYGLPLTLNECPYTIYKCVPISDGEILGSCETYDVRKSISFHQIEKKTLKEVEEKWGDRFVIVGSQKLRYNCLVPPNVSIPTEITSTQYCVLEFIGRSRKNGVTSAGKFSVLHCCKDSAIAFYIRNKLVRLGLITRQAYTEKRSDRLISSSLLTLTRFHSQNKTAFIAIIEKMYLALKNAPNNQMTLINLKRLFPPENQSKIKKILLTHFFRKFFYTCNVCVKELAEVKLTPKMNADREVPCVRLKNPNLSEDELFNDDETTDDKESNDFYDYKHSFADMPLTEEIYRAIEKHGSGGCSQSQLCTILSMNHLSVRQALKKAMSDKIITSYCKDMGRQRTNMLVAANCSNSVKKVKEDNIKIAQNLKCNDEPKFPSDADPPLKDIEQITATIKEVTNLKVNQTIRDETAKQIERKQKIVEVINQNCIMQVPLLRQEIIRCELEAGYKDEICNKSLYRTIARLQKTAIVNLFEISLRVEENARLYRYVTHPKITKDHHVIQQEIIKLKNSLFLYLEEKKFRNVAVRSGQSPKPKVERVGLIPTGPHKAPKFLTARFLHEFMFYMLFEQKPNQQPLTLSEDLLKMWLQSEPNINVSELFKSMSEEHIAPYREEINWRTFITPLPAYEGKPFGWISLPDVVERMPFSLLNKIIHVPPGVDPMALEFLLHPVRQHYLIKQLPLSLQGLINRGRLGKILVNIIRVLQRMGLIQLTEKGGKDVLQVWVYLNRKATVMDTTTSEVGYVKVNPDREYTEIKFNFESYNDMQQYWNCLHKICIHTKLGFVHKNSRAARMPAKVLYKLRRNELNYIVSPVSTFEEAPSLDTGKPPGDGLGAGGIASGLYSSFQRNWTWLVNNKHTAAAAAAVQKLKKNPKFMRTKLSKLMTGSGIKKCTGTPPSMTIKKVNRFAMTSVGRVVKRKGTIVQTKTRSRYPVDPVDRDALKQMRSLRARWTAREDFILKMTRATFLFLVVPVLHFSHRDVARIARDIIRLQCGIHNKTTQACHRRIQFLIKTNRHLPELPTWLHAMQTNEHLSERYGDKFFRELRELYPTKSEFQNALFVHFLYAFGKLQAQLDLTEPQDKRFKNSHFPSTLSEFYKQFRECSPLNENKTLLHLNPTTRIDLQLATINNVLHSSLCCVRDKTQYNLQIFEIFKAYSEDILHTAFKKARLDGLVVARKKANIKTYTTQLTGPSYVFSNKYRLSLMFLRIPYVIFDMFNAFFDQTVSKIFSTEPTPMEIRSPHSAQLFFMGELLSKDCIKVDIKPPSNMLTIDPSAQQSSLTQSERIMDHFHNLLENAPQMEYLKQFDALGELATRVKFKAANEKYKLYYHPFDVVAKLDRIQIHFFCFLGNLNRSLDITFSGYPDEAEDFCPFSDCVMKSDNYLNAIEKIVSDRENSLDGIYEDNHMEADVEGDSITIFQENLLAVFEKFATFVRNKLGTYELKDLGNISLKRKSLDLIGICKDIAKASDDVSNSDEYEPALNKEERIARAQDVFVVNCPVLQISANEELLANVAKTSYKEVMVPESLMEPAIKRDEIIDKILDDTCWFYTQNSVDTLKDVMNAQGLTESEQEMVIKIHDFIESHELGAHASDLVERFPDVGFLQRAIKLLRQHYLVLRAGVSSFMYVQKNHVRHWVIHTRHIKRLVRESMGKLVPSTSQKRKLQDGQENSEPAAKQSRSDDEGRRISKPTVRFEDHVEAISSSLTYPNEELLILKPCPWIRVNGSLNRRVLDKWMATIVIECTVQTGCTVHAIYLRFKQMHPVDIMFLLELLSDLKIIELRTFNRAKVGLFSKFKELDKFSGNEFTDPRNTFIIAAPDAITRMNVFIGDKLYRAEFI